METNRDTKKNDNLEKSLNDFLNDNNAKKEDCVGEECLINDGKEIVERVNKIYKTNDGRQLIM
jgi:hypothetical protein